MIKKIFNLIGLKGEKEILEYVNSLDDEIVKITSIYPLNKSGRNYYSHTLINDSSGNMIFKVNKLIPIFFIFIFSLPFIILYKFILIDLFKDNIRLYIIYIFSVSIYLLLVFISKLYNLKSKIFDFENGYFYDLKYKSRLYELLYSEKHKDKIIPLKEIHAIQIISGIIKTKHRYISYELNLILKDSSRINVVDHSEIKKIRLEAKTIADKLKIKVWDMTSIKIS